MRKTGGMPLGRIGVGASRRLRQRYANSVQDILTISSPKTRFFLGFSTLRIIHRHEATDESPGSSVTNAPSLHSFREDLFGERLLGDLQGGAPPCSHSGDKQGEGLPLFVYLLCFGFTVSSASATLTSRYDINPPAGFPFSRMTSPEPGSSSIQSTTTGLRVRNSSGTREAFEALCPINTEATMSTSLARPR